MLSTAQRRRHKFGHRKSSIKDFAIIIELSIYICIVINVAFKTVTILLFDVVLNLTPNTLLVLYTIV